MKIDRRNPAHWMLLAGFWVQAALGIVLRLFVRPLHGTVVLYGHKLNGNLLALHSYMRENPELGWRPVFLSMDRRYLDELRKQGVDCRWASGPACPRLLADADVLISDHGLHSLGPWRGAYRKLGLRFIDVWHGIPFKGFDADDFRLQHRYDETWVASGLCRDLWIERFGFEPARVHATGYARTDRLVLQREDATALREALGIPHRCRTILFAPTWEQDDHGRSIYPFGCSEGEFLGALSELARSHEATILLRSHMNSGNICGAGYPGIVALPGSRYPDTETVLLASDMLVCDWSSIAFDFLLLSRPTLFLDVSPPFRKEFSLGPEYRFGAIVHNLQELLRQLETCMAEPEVYWHAHADAHKKVRHEVYGDKADGQSAARCVARLQATFSGAAANIESSR
jgi:CDP-glycerol glycerophosphotransferase